MSRVDELVSTLRRDGYVFIRDFLDPAQVQQAAQEVGSCFQRDLHDRAAKEVSEPRHIGPSGMTILTHPSHLLIDAYGRSPSLDLLVERILTDPLSSGVLQRMAGQYLKFRGYNIRRMTGAYDPGPLYPRNSSLPHEWHRDSPGELGIGILLTDIPEGGNAGTALLPGSHLYPYCPRWNTLFSSEYRVAGPVNGIPWYSKYAPCNRLLASRVLSKRQEACGVRGDIFFFFNDVWHGRYPNLHGRESMLVLIGAFATDFPFPDKVNPPSDEVLAKLPPAVRLAASCKAPINQDRDTVLRWMLENRQPLSSLSLFNFSRLERKFAVWLSQLVYETEAKGISGMLRHCLNTFRGKTLPDPKPIPMGTIESPPSKAA